MRVDHIKLRDTFDSLLKTEYTSQKDIQELNKFYIDKFSNLFNVLSNKNSYIVGRRGTGKTTLLYRAYLECMLSFNKEYKSEFLSIQNNLGIFIDLNKIQVLKNDTNENFERDFLREFVLEFKKQVNIFWKPSLIDKITNKRSNIDELFKEIESLIINGEMMKIVDIVSVDKKKINKRVNKSKLGATLTNVSAGVESEDIIENDESYNYELESIEISANLFFEKLAAIQQKAHIQSTFIFLDEYSSLNNEQQIKLSRLLKKMFDSPKTNTFFKISVIADNYNFGELRLERDLHKQSLDISSIITNSSSINNGFNQIQNYTRDILIKRLAYFFNRDFELNEIFNVKEIDDILYELSIASMGVTRTLGKILAASLQKAMNLKSDYITVNQIKNSIKEVSKTYQETLNGMVKKAVLAKEVQDLLVLIIERALKEQKTNIEKQASFFTWIPEKDIYLAKLEENYLVHKIQTKQRLKSEKQDVDVYAIDYGICLDNKITYYSRSSENRQDRDFTQTRFFYDEIAKGFDSHFRQDTKYLCEKCGIDSLFFEKEITLPNGMILINCPKHTEVKFVRVENESNFEKNYSEEEQKIIGFLASIDEKSAFTAVEVQRETGASWQKIFWFAKKKPELIKRIKNNEAARYKYYGNF